MPPNIRDAYHSEAATLYRWEGGRITRVTGHESARLGSRELFAEATVFTQMPDTPHLLAVPVDAEIENVKDHPAGWRRLSFNHVPAHGDTRRTYASIVNLGPEARIAGPGSPLIVGPVLPSVYDYHPLIDSNNRTIPSERDHAGLIGSLPILLALAAFSAPPGLLDQTLTRCVSPGTWIPHSFQRGGKRKEHVFLSELTGCRHSGARRGRQRLSRPFAGKRIYFCPPELPTGGRLRTFLWSVIESLYHSHHGPQAQSANARRLAAWDFSLFGCAGDFPLSLCWFPCC